MHRLQATQYQILDEKKSSIASFKSVNLLLLLFIFTYGEPFIITGLITLSLERRALTQRFFWIHKIRMNRTKLCSQISTLCMGKPCKFPYFTFGYDKVGFGNSIWTNWIIWISKLLSRISRVKTIFFGHFSIQSNQIYQNDIIIRKIITFWLENAIEKVLNGCGWFCVGIW